MEISLAFLGRLSLNSLIECDFERNPVAREPYLRHRDIVIYRAAGGNRSGKWIDL